MLNIDLKVKSSERRINAILKLQGGPSDYKNKSAPPFYGTQCILRMRNLIVSFCKLHIAYRRAK